MIKVQHHHQHLHGRHQRVGMIRGVGPRGINSAYLLGGHLDLSTTCHRADADAIKYTSWGSFISHQLREFQCQRCFREAMIKNKNMFALSWDIFMDFRGKGGRRGVSHTSSKLGQSVEKPRDCPRSSPSGNLSGLGVQNQYFGKSLGPRGA